MLQSNPQTAAQARPTFATRRAGTVYSARLRWGHSRPSHTLRRGRKAAGLRYERKVTAWLDKEFKHFAPQATFEFIGSKSRGYAIPDGLIFDFPTRTIAIIEVKLRHTADAYFQLADLYNPIVRRAFPTWQTKLVEITRTYDPAEVFPCTVELVRDLSHWLRTSPEFGVFVWRS